MSGQQYVHVQVDLTLLYLALKAWLFNRPLIIKIIDEVAA